MLVRIERCQYTHSASQLTANLNPFKHLWDVLDKQVQSIEELAGLEDLLLMSSEVHASIGQS